ncbi:MAG: hypothetical protein AAF499_17055, partial [Pseudomonadota bacterium]
AQAGDLRVKVVDHITGLPVEGASVCLGTKHDVDEFGGARTDASGVASLRAPIWAHRLSVSGNGYKNISSEQPGRQYAFQLDLKANPGRSEPDCRVNPTRIDPAPGIQITSVQVLKSDMETGRVEIQTLASGHTPTHVRVASRDDFSGSSWQEIKNGRSVHYVRNLSDSVYVQARRRVGDDANHIETVSAVVTEAL